MQSHAVFYASLHTFYCKSYSGLEKQLAIAFISKSIRTGNVQEFAPKVSLFSVALAKAYKRRISYCRSVFSIAFCLIPRFWHVVNERAYAESGIFARDLA